MIFLFFSVRNNLVSFKNKKKYFDFFAPFYINSIDLGTPETPRKHPGKSPGSVYIFQCTEKMGWEEDALADKVGLERFRKQQIDSRNCVLLTYFPHLTAFDKFVFAKEMCQIFQSKKHTILNFCAVEEGLDIGSSRHIHMAIETTKRISIDSLIETLRKAKMNVDVHGTALYYDTYFRYLYCPSDHKPLDCLDPKPFTNKDHYKPEPKYEKLRENVKKLNFQGFFNIVRKLDISTEQQLFDRVKDLDSDIQFLVTEFLSRGNRDIQHDIDLINKVSGKFKDIDSPPDRLQVMADTAFLPCTCEGTLHRCNNEILKKNKVSIPKFTSAVLESLIKGAKKGKNVCIVGEASSGKTSILSSLPSVFGKERVFTTPVSTTSMPLLTLPSASVCLLNDFRYNPLGKLSWNDLLQWWEGLEFFIGLPRNFSMKDVLYKEAAPVFITTNERIEQYGNPIISARENKMMDKRLRYFYFSHTFEDPIETYPKCGKCFVSWLRRYSGRPDLIDQLPEPIVPPTKPEALTRKQWRAILDSHKKKSKGSDQFGFAPPTKKTKTK